MCQGSCRTVSGCKTLLVVVATASCGPSGSFEIQLLDLDSGGETNTTKPEAPGCGNGKIDAELNEKCDPPEECPTHCPAPDACTTASLVGSPDQCNAECVTEAIVACAHGDGCCPLLCDYPNDNDCPFDCAAIPRQPLSVKLLDSPRGHDGLVIDTDGYMLGIDGNNLVRAQRNGDATVIIPRIGEGHQLAWLPDGDIAFATDDGSITRITTSGVTSKISTNVMAYGVITGPDGMLYVSSRSRRKIMRIDPTTGVVDELFSGFPSSSSPRAIGFSPDGRRLYIGTTGVGRVHYLDFDDTMEVVGDLETLVGTAETGLNGDTHGWHDTAGVDACGNLYISDYTSTKLFRVSPSGVVTLYYEPPTSRKHLHSIVWGTGEHGWLLDAIYMSEPYNDGKVLEIVTGVPSRDFAGLVIHRPEQRNRIKFRDKIGR